MKVKLTAAAALAAALAIAQTPAVVVSPVPQLQFFDNNGKPLSGGQVCTYAAGTTTPLTTYTSSTGTVANPNPVILDASGRANIWIAAPAIKYVLRAKGSPQNCSNGTTLYTVDGVQDQALKLRTDITGPNGLAMLTYTPPPTAATPTPGGGPIPANLRAAQIVNVQDFDAPPFATCGVSSHDDTPASQKAVDYATKNGGGTVTWPRGGQCWFNSATQPGLAAIHYWGSNIIFDGNGSTANSTVTGIALFGGTGVNSLGLPWKTWSDATRERCGYQEVFPGAFQITVSPGCGGRFLSGSALYIESGPVIGGTPTNGEGNVVTQVSGDTLKLRYPVEHHFFYQNPPDGIMEVTADTIFNLTYRRWRTPPQFTNVMFGFEACIHCQLLDLDGDFTNTGAMLGNNNYNRDLLEDNVNITETNPNAGYSPVVQFSTGTSDWTIRRSNLTCNTATPGTFTVINWTEGASNDVFTDGTISGNCVVGGATYQTAILKDSRISLDTGPTQPEITWAGSGTGPSTNLRMTGNTMIFPNTGNKTNIVLAGDRLQFMGNRITSSATTGYGAIVVTQSCGGCMIEGNILQTGGHGIVLGQLAAHSFSVVNNNIICTGGASYSYDGIQIGDDGQQTAGETVMGNTANGCVVGLAVNNIAHEIGVFTPNSFAGNMSPYSPASIGGQLPIVNPVTNLTGIQDCPVGWVPAYTPPGLGLVIGCSANNSLMLMAGTGGVVSLVIGTPAFPSDLSFGIDSSGNVGGISFQGSQYLVINPNLIRFVQPTQINSGLSIGSASFTFNGKTCVISGTSISCT
jgi:hypothetical protein